MIQFRQFTESDFDVLISWVETERALLQFSGPVFKFPLTRDQLELNISNHNRHAYAIIDSLDRKMIAYAEILITAEKVSLLSRIIIGDKNMRGKGIGSKIMQQLLYISFETFGTEKAMLYVFDWNTSAIKCYEKAGFIINREKTGNLE